jgi:hypothetical protein
LPAPQAVLATRKPHEHWSAVSPSHVVVMPVGIQRGSGEGLSAHSALRQLSLVQVVLPAHGLVWVG